MMRTVVIAVVILFMTTFVGCGTASAQPDWSQPNYVPPISNNMQQFLRTQSRWELPLDRSGLIGPVELPSTAPPKSDWAPFEDVICKLTVNFLPVKGEKWAAEKLARWATAAKFLPKMFSKAIEFSVDNECTSALDQGRELASDALSLLTD